MKVGITAFHHGSFESSYFKPSQFIWYKSKDVATQCKKRISFSESPWKKHVTVYIVVIRSFFDNWSSREVVQKCGVDAVQLKNV